MTTYSALRDRALSQVSCTGQTEAESLAATALEEAMKFVAFHVRIPSLIAEAAATAPANPMLEASAITLGASGFNIAATYQAPDRLYVKNSSASTERGPAYEFLEFNHFLDLKNIPNSNRAGIFTPATYDERPYLVYTITPTDKIWATPLAAGNVLSFFYRKSPAAYSALVAPEILPMFDYILVNGAVVALKEWLREPDSITTWWTLFEQALTKDVQRYDLFLNGQRKRSHLQIHRSYRP